MLLKTLTENLCKTIIENWENKCRNYDLIRGVVHTENQTEKINLLKALESAACKSESVVSSKKVYIHICRHRKTSYWIIFTASLQQQQL